MINFIIRSAFLLLLSLTGAAPLLYAQSITWELITRPPMIYGYSYSLAASSSGTLFTTDTTLLRSRDLGETWDVLPLPSDLLELSRLRVGPDDDNLYACGNGGVSRSTDEGKTWASVTPDIRRSFSHYAGDIFFGSGGELYVPIESVGWLRSTDQGMQWDTVLACTFPGTFTESSDGLLFATVADSSTAGIYRSTNRGTTWTFSGLRNIPMFDKMHTTTNGTILAAAHELQGKGKILRSTDGGKSWSSTTFRDICYDIISGPEGELFASGANSGIFRSVDDGATWTSINGGLLDSRVFPIVMHPNGYLYIIGVGPYLYRSSLRLSSAPVGEQEKRSHSVHPNPATDYLTIELGRMPSGTAHIILFDAFGQPAAATDIPINAAGDALLRMDCRSLASGLYHYSIAGNDVQIRGSVVIVR